MNSAQLDAFLRSRFPGLAGSITIEKISGGQSNPTFFVTYANRRLVLRRKPAGEVLPSAHAIDREYRVITALAATEVPVPRALLYEEDASIVGTPFYVMERLEGRVIHDNALPGLLPEERAVAFGSVAQTLARLHAVDWAAAGLADFGRPAGFYSRQIARWTRQHELSKGGNIPELDRLVAWLPENIPAGGETTAIIHGDFRFGNMMLHTSDARVVGVLDWELSTLGDPLADLAHFCMIWHSSPAEYCGLAGLPLAALGIPSEAEFVEEYYRLSGSRMRLQPFHLAFALFRFAVIFEGIAQRARAGSAASENASELSNLPSAFARRAVEVVDGRPHF